MDDTPAVIDEQMPTAKRWPRWTWWVAGGAVFLSALIAAAAWFLVGHKVWTDGGTIYVADRDAKVRDVVWARPQPMPGFESDEQVYEPSISPDGTELYFVRGKAGRNAKIYVCCRQHNAWTAPAALDAVNGPFDSLGPRVSADGRFLLFYSDRPGGFGGYDIWAAPRLAGGGWGKPFNLGAHVNSEFNEFNPDPTPDGKRLIFATNRKAAKREQNEAWRSTIRETVSSDYDLWIADAEVPLTPSDVAPDTQPTTLPTNLPSTQPAAGATLAYRRAREIPGVNTSFTEGASCMSPAGDFLYFASNRPGGLGKFDIYRCRVYGDQFGAVENVGPPINSAENEADPALAYNGFRMVFSSDRPGADGRYQLLIADSREVYPLRQGHPLPALGWSWWLLLISALVLIPLLMFLRGWDDRRLGLLQKCLLLSLLLHALITFILSFVVVTQKVTQYVRRESEMEIGVSLGEGQGVDERLAIRSQLSGSELPVSSAPPMTLAPARQESETLQAAAAPTEMKLPTAPLAAGGMTIPLASPRHISAATPSGAPAAVVGVSSLAESSPLVDVKLSVPRALSQAETLPRAELTVAASPRKAEAGEAETPAPASVKVATGAITAGEMPQPGSRAIVLPAGSLGHVAGLAVDGPRPAPDARAAEPGAATVSIAGMANGAARQSAPEPQLATASNRASATTAQGPLHRSTPDAMAGAASPAPIEIKPFAESAAPLGGQLALLAPTSQTRPAGSDAAAAASEQAVPRPTVDGPQAPQIAVATGGLKDRAIATTEPSLASADVGETRTARAASASDAQPFERAPSRIDVPGLGAGASPAPRQPLSLTSAAHTSVAPPVASSRSPAATPIAAAPYLASGPLELGPKVHIPDGASASAGSEKPILIDIDSVASALRPAQPSGEGNNPPSLELASSALPKATLTSPAASDSLSAPPQPHVGSSVIASSVAASQATVDPLDGPLGPASLAAAPDLPFVRSPEQRKPLLEKFGGTPESEDAVARGLAYLARMQQPDGRWTRVEDDRVGARRRRDRHDMACTGFALLAFLAHDDTPDKPGRYHDVVAAAVDFLIGQQDEDGDLRGPAPFRGGGADAANMYDHGIAAYALAECAIMTRDPRTIEAAMKAARFIVAAQNAESGGWRYSPNEFGDSSVFGWQIMALHSAEQVGFKIPPDTIAGARRYIESCAEGHTGFLAGYQPHSGPTPAMTAELLFCRMLLDMPLDEDGIGEATRFLARDPPDVRRADLYYWYYASLSMLHMRNPLWKDWNVLTRESLIQMQRTDGPSAGCWDTNFKWGERGGRIFTTAMSTLTLEVYYRYLPLRKESDAARQADERSPRAPETR